MQPKSDASSSRNSASHTRLSLFDGARSTKPFQTAVSLHAHTQHSRETIAFVPQYIGRVPILKDKFGRWKGLCMLASSPAEPALRLGLFNQKRKARREIIGETRERFLIHEPQLEMNLET